MPIPQSAWPERGSPFELAPSVVQPFGSGKLEMTLPSGHGPNGTMYVGAVHAVPDIRQQRP